ncbi:MAG: hypothetical protein PHG97_02945, partial [Candidatus Margulisbacteria bacterium]|nr:hypothetical protein [Candidatus Margulisiibacteriota bacterium]
MDRPIVFITIAFAAGIAAAKTFPFVPFWLTFLFVLIFFCLSIYAYWQKINLSFLILILCFLSGFLLLQ